MEDGAGRPGPVMKKGPEALGNGKDPLADGHVGKDVIHQVSRGLGHALRVTGRADASALAGERNEEVIAAARASGPSEAVGQDAAGEIAPELLFHVIRHAVAGGSVYKQD